MSDAFKTLRRGLCPQMAAMIDAAVAEGRVTVVPVAVSGLPVPRWDEKTRRLVYADGAAMMRRSIGALNPKGRRPLSAETLARRAAVADRHAAGMTPTAIATAMGLSLGCVRGHIEALGLTPHAAPHPLIVAAEVKRDRLRAILAEGATRRDAAERMGESYGWVVEAARKAGIAVTAAPKGRKRRASAAVLARRAAIAAAHAAGEPRDALLQRLGIRAATLNLDLRAMGLQWPGVRGAPKGLGLARSRDRHREARVVELRAAGLGWTAIGRAIGLDRSEARRTWLRWDRERVAE